MSKAIRRKPGMKMANPYNDIKLLFNVIIFVLFLFVYKKIQETNLKKQNYFNKHKKFFFCSLYAKNMFTHLCVLKSTHIG